MDPRNPIPVESSTLKALAIEGRREWTITEPWFYLLLFLILIDIVLGLMFAFKRQDVSSGAFWDGMKKKTSMVLVVAALVVVDPFVPGITLSVLATTAYVFMELLSITETAGRMGAPLPDAVLRVLRAMKPPEAQKVSVVASVQIDANVTNTRQDPMHTTTDDLQPSPIPVQVVNAPSDPVPVSPAPPTDNP